MGVDLCNPISIGAVVLSTAYAVLTAGDCITKTVPYAKRRGYIFLNNMALGRMAIPTKDQRGLAHWVTRESPKASPSVRFARNSQKCD
jgi:hypothetical protein